MELPDRTNILALMTRLRYLNRASEFGCAIHEDRSERQEIRAQLRRAAELYGRDLIDQLWTATEVT